MNIAKVMAGGMVCGLLLVAATGGSAQDWPQWRGPNRDNKVTGFNVPATWPKELTQKWKVTVGLGDASPALVGDKLYVFAREGDRGDEVIACLDAGSGKVLWQDKYPTVPVTNNARGHSGPRSAPAVAEGKVCTLGVGGVLSCLDANTGKLIWRKDTKSWPAFYTASSPLIVDGKFVAQTGGRGNGAIAAYDLNSGEPKWTWTGEGPGYGSPVLLTAEGSKQIVALTEGTLVGIDSADGKLLWQVPFRTTYNSNTPIIDGTTVISSGPAGRGGRGGGGGGGGGTVAVKIEKQGSGFTAQQLWQQTQAAGIYNTPVLKDGLLFGLAPVAQNTSIFCMDAKTGKMLWNDDTRRGQCGTILDAGPVLVALTNDGNLLVFKPSRTAYEEVARYNKVGNDPWAYPILAGNRIFVKDRDSVILWTIE